jgi:hypothetical protein
MQLAAGTYLLLYHTIQFGSIGTVGSMIACLPSIHHSNLTCGPVFGAGHLKFLLITYCPQLENIEGLGGAAPLSQEPADLGLHPLGFA